MENPDTNRNVVLARVRESLALNLSDGKGEKLEALRVLKVIERPFSTIRIIEMVTSAQARKAVIKTTVHHPVNKMIIEGRNQAVIEYDILAKLYPRFLEVDGCSVPRPILVIPEIETYVMAYVKGRLLEEEHPRLRFFTSRKNFQNLELNYFYCGKWLKHFQTFTGAPAGDANVLDGLLGRCDHRLDLLERSGDGRFSASFRAGVMRFLHDQAAELAGFDIPLSGRHGDFGPWNIIAGSQGVTVIDFLGYKKEPTPIDIWRMLVYFDDQKAGLTFSRDRIDALKDSFLEGLGGLPPIEESLRIICETLHRVTMIEGNLSRPALRLHHRVERDRSIKVHLEWLMRHGALSFA